MMDMLNSYICYVTCVKKCHNWIGFDCDINMFVTSLLCSSVVVETAAVGNVLSCRLRVASSEY